MLAQNRLEMHTNFSSRTSMDERVGRRCEDDVEIDVTGRGWEGVGWNNLVEISNQWRALFGTVMNFLVP